MAPRAGRSLSFAGDVLGKDDVSEPVEEPVEVAPPARRSLIKVESMVQRKKSKEGGKARIDSPAKLYSTINPQYTYQKACELYGGAPRPLSGRYTFVRMAFLADTEDWRSNALVGNANSPIARMDITNPERCTYLEEASERKMSYTRQKSLSRAISYRQTLVKRNGELADSQYTDQYLDKETVAATLKKQQSTRQSVVAFDDGAVELGRSLGGQPSRVLASFVSRSARTASAPGAQGKQLNVADKGMSRAVSRIMTRTRTVKLSISGATAFPGVGDDDEESMEECPRMEDI